MVCILFVCLGNICRSPMAEFIFKKLSKDAGLEKDFYIESAATSSWEIGNPVYPPAAKELYKHGISAKGKTARRLEKNDYNRFDFIIGMEETNIRDIKRILGVGSDGKIYKLLDFAKGGDIADPWYTGDFKTAYEEISEGCSGLLEFIKSAHNHSQKDAL